MYDYVVSSINDIDDPLTHYVLFSDCNPTVFEVVVKEEKWKKTMDEEVAAPKI